MKLSIASWLQTLLRGHSLDELFGEGRHRRGLAQILCHILSHFGIGGDSHEVLDQGEVIIPVAQRSKLDLAPMCKLRTETVKAVFRWNVHSNLQYIPSLNVP